MTRPSSDQFYKPHYAHVYALTLVKLEPFVSTQNVCYNFGKNEVKVIFFMNISCDKSRMILLSEIYSSTETINEYSLF